MQSYLRNKLYSMDTTGTSNLFITEMRLDMRDINSTVLMECWKSGSGLRIGPSWRKCFSRSEGYGLIIAPLPP